MTQDQKFKNHLTFQTTKLTPMGHNQLNRTVLKVETGLKRVFLI